MNDRRWRRFGACLLLAFLALAIPAHSHTYFSWDPGVAARIQRIPGVYGLMSAASQFGNGWTPFVVTVVTCLLFLAFRLRGEAAGLGLCVALGALINRVLKFLIARQRPEAGIIAVLQQPGGLSFPSGHVALYVGFFGFLWSVSRARLPPSSRTRRLLLILLPIPVALVGVSRVYLGAHWPSDVIGAYLWSSAWLLCCLRIFRHWLGADAAAGRLPAAPPDSHPRG